jgi:NitT/TauT family transport system permease protein
MLLGAGYVVACFAGIALGTLMGRYKLVFNACEPLIELLRPVPKPALLPPLILLLGVGNELKIAIVALGAVFPVLINALQGARAVDSIYINTARTFGYGGIGILFRVVLPAASPMIVAGMKVSLGLGLVLVVLAEMLAGAGGLGAEIIDMQRSFRITQMYAWVVILSVVGLCLALLFNAVERRLTFWKAKSAGR